MTYTFYFTEWTPKQKVSSFQSEMAAGNNNFLLSFSLSSISAIPFYGACTETFLQFIIFICPLAFLPLARLSNKFTIIWCFNLPLIQSPFYV